MDLKISRKVLSVILPAIMMIAMATGFVFAEPSGIDYLDRREGNEETKTLAAGEYNNFSDISGGNLTSGTYVVDRDITLNDRLVISGEVKIILMDGKTLNCPYGVTVAGSNNLYVYGQGEETGKLVAGTASNATSAAIGGGDEGDAGNITIYGGNITADASAGTYGAGIGGGDKGYGGTVTIWGGTVNATGAEFGAGIGSGDQPKDAPVMTVNIYGGTVTATGGDEAAGIGGGNEGNGATVNISGGTVTASGGNQDVGEGAGIGGGDEGDGGVVTISGGYVKATGGHRAAGIGGGADGSNSRVIITGGEVHAYGGGVKTGSLYESGGAGIGGGAKGYGGVIIIKGGDVEVRGFRGGAGLGGGYGGSVTTVAISGDETIVRAGSDSGGAGIGGGYGGDAYNIGISGGNIEAYSNSQYTDAGGAAIGSGHEGYAANISISDGTIRAVNGEGNHGAAAIGGGNKGYFGNIRIEGGTITSAHAYGGGAGIGSGSESEKKSEQPVGKITISGGTIRAGSTAAYSNNSTGAGIGSGSHAKSPVNVEISGGTIDAYCGMDDGSSNKKMDYSGAGIGTGYASRIGTINITGGTIKATRGTGCTKADPIGYYDNEQDTVYSEIRLNYDNAQIRNKNGAGSDNRVTNTQYDSSDTNRNRHLAIIDHETDWVEIKPCDHLDATYKIVSGGEDGKHRLTCDYCLGSADMEETHTFDGSNKCQCGYYRYKLTFTDGQQGGNSKDYYVYPDVSNKGEVLQNKLIQLKNYAPTFVVGGKKFDVWKTDSDPTGKTYASTDDYVMTGNTIFVAQWTTISGVTIVLSSIDGPLDLLHVEDQSSATKLDALLAASEAALNEKVAKHEDYVLGTERGSKPMTEATNMDVFNDLSGSGKTVADLNNNILYLAMLKKIDDVEVELEAPVCGTTIVTTGGSTASYEQNPRPVVTAKGEGYVIDGAKRWQRYDNGSYAPASYPSGDIVIKGGYPHYVSLAVDAAYGYRFIQGTDETSVTLNEEAAMIDGTKTVESYRITFNAQIKGVHDFGEWEAATPATCTAKGTEQRKCKVDGCDGTETRETEIDSDAHDYGEPKYTWADDYSSVTAEVICSHNSEHKITEKVDTKSSVVKEATCTEKGRTKYTAVFTKDVFTNQSKTVDTDIDPDAHDYGEPKYTWADDNSSVTAEIVCSHNSEHNITEDVAPNITVIKEGTCTEKGTTKYTAVFTKDVFTNQSKTVDTDIDLDAHDWGEWKVTKEATQTAEGEEERTCSRCDSKETRPIKKLDPTPTPKKVTATSILLAKQVAKGNKSLVISWTRVNSANGYDIFFARCGSGSLKKIKTIKGNKTLKWTRKGLKKRASYKAIVKAYVIKNGKKTYVATSPMVHAYTSGGTKRYTNPKSVKMNRTSVSLKAGKTYKIKASVTKLRKGKRLIPAAHAPKLRYLSSNKKVATINSKGVIKAVGKGSCNVYVYAANGIWKTCKVSVN